MKRKHQIIIAALVAILTLTNAAAARERHSVPPMNVAAEHMNALIGGTVFVGHEAAENTPSNRDYRKLKIIVYGPLGNGEDGVQGRHVMCNHSHITNEWYLEPRLVWWPTIVRKGEDQRPVLMNTQGPRAGTVEDGSWLTPNYNPANGDIVWYRPWQGHFEDHNIGHLQARIPAAVYDLCPDFPSPEELGMEVNTAQTADRYDALMAQHTDRRILRPDLVTPGLREAAGWKGR